MDNTNTAEILPEPQEPSTSDMVVRLGHAFLRFAQRDGDQSSEALSQHLNKIQEKITKLQQLSPTSQQSGLLADATYELNQIVVSFQFFDRISQRMDHALKCLQTLESVDLSTALDSEFNLYALRALLTMEDERHVFDQVVSGIGVGKAIDNAITLSQQVKPAGDDIELF